MQSGELAKKLGLEAAAGCDAENAVTGCYIGDLLSLVMSKATQGDCWITVQSNINVVAVASLTETAMIILAEGVRPDPNTAAKANDEGIPIYCSKETAYSLAVKISELI